MLRLPSLPFLLIALVGSVGVAAGLPRVDATRAPRAIDEALLFLPEPEHLRMASLGFEEPVADLLWIRVALTFGERAGIDSRPAWTEWLRRMIRTVNALDPRWRTAYYYGGTLLRVVGDIEGSDLVFDGGRTNLPDDAFFPFSLGMNAYLYRDDAVAAGVFLEEAAGRPGAPSWYAAAAAAMRARAGARAAGIRFLEEVRATSLDPAVVADAERQLGRLRHAELVDGWQAACRRFRAERGRPLASPAELEALGYTLPANPRGDAWTVGADGIVRSEGAERERYIQALRAERPLFVP